MQGVRGGKDGTDFNMNLRPLFKAPEELDPSSCPRAWGGETRLRLGELTLSDLTGVDASFRMSGVSSSRRLQSLLSESSAW